jgi:hypothetical protein
MPCRDDDFGLLNNQFHYKTHNINYLRYLFLPTLVAAIIFCQLRYFAKSTLQVTVTPNGGIVEEQKAAAKTKLSNEGGAVECCRSSRKPSLQARKLLHGNRANATTTIHTHLSISRLVFPRCGH